ncbi:hypothetical protein [Bacteroides fragilis]|jgi:hypothetical protein|uniref:hypothetical protein n=1 Tax=Bacteroides fragilis TaxID=817 RepID=UPI0011B423E2|nr:hypothetical protein [Bacteroides fragilis]KAB5416843.1 hypothetical protein F9000_21400 [Bacteroides fragilis]KAB5427006.1 hypothetical protein F9Z99_21370 [Bacteroides fragilis]MBU9018673.1 hypothetical protein [Bacteroides fragilis]MBU9022800.1 hypothetical protein [Bacteroides fragilis]MBU9083491.1 hypothetical protein [Bacteroides fragilis]
METTTKYDTIINFFLDNWIIATIVVAAVVIGFIPSLREGVLILFGKNRRKNKDIGDKIDTQLLRLLIKADEAIRKEHQDYYLHGCGSAFDDVYALSDYLVRFKVRYQKDEDAKIIIDGNDDLYNLDKASECYNGFEEPRYYEVIGKIHKSIQRLLEKRLPK